MVHGHHQRGGDGVGAQRRAHRDGQRLVPGPTATQCVCDLLRARFPLPGKLFGSLQRVLGVFMPPVLHEQFASLSHRVCQRLFAQQSVHHHRQHARRQVAVGLRVGQGRGGGRELEDLLGVVGPERDRRRPDHAAAVLRVVDRPVEGARRADRGELAQRGDAAAVRRAHGEQVALLDQPAVGLGVAHRERPGGLHPRVALGVQPALVGQLDRGKRGVGPGGAGDDVPADEAFQGEQRHLGVVGELARLLAGAVVLGDAHRAEPAADLVHREELHRRAERIADRPGQHRAEEPAAELGFGGIFRRLRRRLLARLRRPRRLRRGRIRGGAGRRDRRVAVRRGVHRHLRRHGGSRLDQVLGGEPGLDRAGRVDLHIDAGEVVRGQLSTGHSLPGRPVRRQERFRGEHLQLPTARFVHHREQPVALRLREQDQLGVQHRGQQRVSLRVPGGGELQGAFDVVGRRG